MALKKNYKIFFYNLKRKILKMDQSCYTRKDLASMLHADSIARKKKQWDLVSSAEILDLEKRLGSRFGKSIKFDQNEMLVIGKRVLRPLRVPFKKFRKTFVFVDVILAKFPGKVIVAGGSVYKAFIGSEKRVDRHFGQDHYVDIDQELLNCCDVDFFFVDCTKDEVEEIIKFAWELVSNHDKTRHYLKRNGEDDYFDVYYACADRCQNTTTIYYSSEDNDLNYLAEFGWQEGGKMQFIHRIYPNKASVIGGFDLGPCMCLYDGIDFWATPLGAWSIVTQTIILDVTRRSTSFEHRISKYVVENDCRLVIVNGSNAELYQYLALEPTMARREVRVLYPVKGLRVISRHIPHAKYVQLIGRESEYQYGGRAKINEEGKSIDEILRLAHEEDAKWETQHLFEDRERTMAEAPQNLNRFYCRFNARNRISDYDGGEFNAYTVDEANGIFASRGKIDCITWRSKDTETIFANPKLRCEIHHSFTGQVLPVYLSIEVLRRWFPEDKVVNIIDGPIDEHKRVPVNKEILAEAIDDLREIVNKNSTPAQEKASKGITIITENPGRQWTSSYNPVVGNVRDYYHPAVLKARGPLRIGVPDDVVHLLSYARLSKNSNCDLTWRLLPKDVFKLIMLALADLLAEDGNQLLLGFRY